MTKMRYPSGQYVTYEYDSLDRLVKEVYHNSDESVQVEYQYIYSSDGQLAKQQAIQNGTLIESYSFEYDSLGRLIRSREDRGAASVQWTEHLYDTANRLTKQNWTVGERNFTEAYGYNIADGTMASMQITYDAPTASGGLWVARDKLTYTYDDLNRLTQVLDTENYSTQFYTRNYTYQDLSGNRTTSRLVQYDYRNPGDNDSIIYGNSYAYDANGNITQINEVYTVNGTDTSRVLAEYKYDGLNQLTKETRYTYMGTSATAASTTVVTYTIDTAGNIRSVTTKVDGTTTGTVSYTYGNNYWADKLTAISVNGTSRNISYGDYCNPSTWFNGTDYTGLTWTQGRRLSGITKGSNTYSYEYDMSGVRSVKIADGLRHEYVTQNGKVVRETVSNASTGAFQYMLDFTYDESGHPLTMRRYYDETQTSYNTYHYVLNAQGDVIKLLHGSNTTAAEYSYDAWGNILTATGSLADINPLRYRGYYFDSETGFYYLQSRYYDPIVKRFLNADNYSSTGQGFLGYNMFAYCENNPTLEKDDSGEYSTQWTEWTDGGKNQQRVPKPKRRAVIFYYVRSDGKDFSSQATSNFAFAGSYTSTTRVSFNTMEDLIQAWENMPETDDVFIYVHGTDSSLEFPDGSLEDMSQLSASKIAGTIYLFSCHGNSIAHDLAAANNCSVVSCAGTVSFSTFGSYSYPYAGGKWKNFLFGRKYDWYETTADGQSTQLVGNCLIAVGEP